MRLPRLTLMGSALCALALLTLSGCGFHLKKASVLPSDFMSMQLVSADPRSNLSELLKQELVSSKVELFDDAAANRVRLTLFKDKLERRTLSLFKNGQVAEYELAYSVSYQVQRPGSDAITQGFELYRTYQDDPDQALAKSRELNLILAEMRKQASRRIVRELAQL